MKHLGDITKIHGDQIPAVDVITGGSPCQDLSVAGLRKGLAGERSGLFMEQIRIVKEMRNSGRTNEYFRPARYMVWENVPGAISSGTPKGEDFRIVLEEIARVCEPDAVIPRPDGGWKPSGCIVGRNWSAAWKIHDAQWWGVPQRRKRICLLCDFDGYTAPEILFDPQLRRETEGSESDKTIRDTGAEPGQQIQSLSQSLSGNTEQGIEEREGTPGGTEDSVGSASCYGISPFDSEGMKSANPHAGFYKADSTRTLDNNGGNPSCNQGGGGGSSTSG